MQNTRIIAKSLWRDGTIIARSSQNPQFPAESTQDDDTALTWRSRSGAGSGNGLFRLSSAWNRLICFDEGAGKLVANLTAGDYNGHTLAAHIAAVMSAVGGDYTCTYSELTGKFTIARPAGNFTLYFADDGTTSDALGFNAETKTGAATYTSDNRRIHTEEYIALDVGAAAEVDFVALLNHNFTATATITLFGADDAAFTTGLTTDVLAYNAANGYWILPAPRTKRYYQIHIVNRPNSNLCVSIGTIVLGKARDLGGPFRRGWGRGYVNDSASEETPSRNLFLTQARPAVRSWSCSWTNLSDAAQAYIEEAVRECGGVYCLMVCTNASDPMNNSFWFRMVDPPLAENISANRWSWTCDFIGQP